MSYENAKEFLSRLSTDPNLGTKADEAYLNALINLASEYGLNISLSELQLAMADMARSGEIPEAFLESTVGGALSFGSGTRGLTDSAQFFGRNVRR